MKIVSAEEAVADIRSGDQVYVQCAAATPSALLDALVARSRELHNVSMVHLHTEGPGPAPCAGDGAPLPASRAVHRAERPPGRERGPCRVHPGLPVGRAAASSRAGSSRSTRSSATSRRLMRTGTARWGRRWRRCRRRSRSASLVIAQVNAAMPRTLGESFVHVDDIDYGVEVDIPPYVYHAGEIGEVERRIGEFVADLVPDGATLQMGIGAIPVAIAAFLRDKKRPRDPHGDDDRLRRRPGRGGRRHRDGEGAQPGQDRLHVHDGDGAALPLRPRQPDGRDAGLRLHERHPRHPRASAG